MTDTPTASSVQLARAEALGKALTHRGWIVRHESRDKHPGAVEATVYTHRPIEILILTLGGRAGQMVEITAPNTGLKGGIHRIRDVSKSWRMTAYDAPIEAILGAAAAVLGKAPELSQSELAGWTVEHAPHCETSSDAVSDALKTEMPSGRRVRATRFTRRDGAVTATFHLPNYTPPCQSCTHDGDLGDSGGWLISGPGFTAEATAHIPEAVIAAFAHGLPVPRSKWHAASAPGTRWIPAVR